MRKLLTMIAGIAGLVLVFFFGRGISRILYADAYEGTTVVEAETEPQIADTTALPVSPTPSPEPAKAALTEKELDGMLEAARVEQEIPIDFEQLWESNTDIYAWISVPGTEIEYPILQHETDNTFYLMHNLDGSYGYPGCIYTENLNSKDFTDNNTVIYGHNMKNGSMFAQLHKFEDKDFFDENGEILIYLPNQILHYTIFAAYVYDDRHLLYSFDFQDAAVYEDYLATIYEDSSANIRQGVEVTTRDQIITLATCLGQQPDKRLLVQAVRQEE